MSEWCTVAADDERSRYIWQLRYATPVALDTGADCGVVFFARSNWRGGLSTEGKCRWRGEFIKGVCLGSLILKYVWAISIVPV